MSRELTFWKPGPRLTASRGEIALGINDFEIPGLEPLDAERLLAAVDAKFPGWRSSDGPRWYFECDVDGVALSLTLRSRTPAEVEAWFRELARREGLDAFDYEVDEITAADKRAHKRREAAARDALREDEEAEAREEYQRLLPRAEAGDATAQLLVGQRLSFGEGVEADPARAAGWYERAAGAGNPDAMVNLAALLRQGRGVARDLAAAAAWLERALPHDGCVAAYELGQVYAKGEGVAVDSARAEKLFRIALANGHPEARRALRLLGLVQ